MKVQTPPAFLSAFQGLKQVYLRLPNASLAPYKIRGYRVHQDAVLLKFFKIVTRNDSETLRGAEVLIASDDLPLLPEGEYYAHQLVGMAVQRESSEPLGTLSEVLATGSNDVYVVKKPDGTELLLPVLESVVRKIDVPARAITVVVPDGLE
ncbi:MAG: 16S rRNA processing protein RimM [Blastocatellia bacterium]|nr:16S rRNA processing protein RimM [Blastocatellia bacterium]